MTVVTVTVKIEGQAAPQDWGLMSVDVRRELNRLPSARLVYIDGDVADGSFPISDTGRFKPGAAVEIVARYEGAEGPGAQDKVLFKGLVVRHGLEAGAHGSVLQVELRDKAVALTRPRRSLVSVDAKDSDVLAKLLRNAGLQAQVEATSVQHPSLVQFDCTDWDWLVTRAEACGQVVAVTDGVVKVATPALSGPATLKVTWGTDVIDMDLSCDALGQDDGVDVSSWNAADLAVAAAQAVRPPAPAQGSLTGEKAA